MSVLSEVACETPGETIDFMSAYMDAGASVAGVEYCFIATAAFGDYDHPVVRDLRRFRDEILVKIPGRDHFVSLYYRLGPERVASIHSLDAWRTIRTSLAAFSRS